MSIKRRRGGGSSSEWLKRVNQEDLLAEIAERLQLELNNAGMTVAAFGQRLGKPSDYIEELLDGLVNISARELADIFSVFNKIVALDLISQDGSAKVLRKQADVFQINNARPVHSMSISYVLKEDLSLSHQHDFTFIDVPLDGGVLSSPADDGVFELMGLSELKGRAYDFEPTVKLGRDL